MNGSPIYSNSTIEKKKQQRLTLDYKETKINLRCTPGISFIVSNSIIHR